MHRDLVFPGEAVWVRARRHIPGV